MPTYQRCPESVEALANVMLNHYSTHQPLNDAQVKIDFVFAFPDYDEKTGEAKNDAIKRHGVKALGVARKIPLKDRALGRGDAEILLDGEWWQQASEAEQSALLDHELHHLEVKLEDGGSVKRDDLERPMLQLRKHDYEFGWFRVIAARHGASSQEQVQANRMMEDSGQYFWPELSRGFQNPEEGTITIESDGKSTTMTTKQFSQLAKAVA